MINITNIQVDESGVTEPVTLQQVKDWLAIDFTDFDTLLTSMIKGARQTIEGYTNRTLVAKTVTIDAELTKADTVVLPYASNIDSITVSKIADDDTETAYSDYYQRGNQVRILSEGRYKIEYTTVPSSNQDLLEAVKMEVAERFNNRGENGKQLSTAAKEKILPHQMLWL